MIFIGIDVGTTSIGVAILDLEKRKIVEIVNKENNSWIQSNNEWERIQDTKIVLKNISSILEGFFKKYKDIGGICVTGQMHGIIYLDREGNALSPLYTWQDNRGRLDYKNKKTYAEELSDLTNCRMFTGYGLVTHFYNFKNNLVPEGIAYISTIADYISMKLCGLKKPSIDFTNAESIGCFDLNKYMFQYDSLEKAGIESGILPEVYSSRVKIGLYKDSIPVINSIADNQASILGSSGNIEETVNINIGTGGQISVYSDKYVSHKEIEIRPFFDKGYIFVGASLCSGRAYHLLESFFKNTFKIFDISYEEKIYDKMNSIDPSFLNSSNRLIIDTRFEGTRNNSNLRGSIKNIGTTNFTPQNMISGFLYGIAEEQLSFYKIINKYIGQKPKQIIATGNGIRKNNLLRLIFENVFNLPIKITTYNEEAAVGAAINAAIGTNNLDSYFNNAELISYI